MCGNQITHETVRDGHYEVMEVRQQICDELMSGKSHTDHKRGGGTTGLLGGRNESLYLGFISLREV